MNESEMAKNETKLLLYELCKNCEHTKINIFGLNELLHYDYLLLGNPIPDYYLYFTMRTGKMILINRDTLVQRPVGCMDLKSLICTLAMADWKLENSALKNLCMTSQF